MAIIIFRKDYLNIMRATSFFILIIALLTNNSVYGQILCISGGKLNAYSADVLVKDEIECELNFSTDVLKKSESNITMRVTYGLENFIEIGIDFPYNCSNMEIGTKIIIINNDFFKMSKILGLNYSTFGKLFTKKFCDNSIQKNIIYGFATSFIITENMNLDFNILNYKVYNISKERYQNIVLLNEITYSFNDNCQIILSFKYEKDILKNYHSSFLNITHGLLFSCKNLCLIFGVPFVSDNKKIMINSGVEISCSILLN